MRIYIDTSVINGLYSQDKNIKIDTQNFFKFAKNNNAVLYSADLIVEEIDRTPDSTKREKLKNSLAEYNVEFLPFSDDIKQIADKYILEKIIPHKYLPDAIHIATAIIHNIPVLVSWNFKHIVKLKTKVEINRINREMGYPQVNICSPKEV